MQTKTIKCRGKINLSLNILGKRNDGYHYIDTVMMHIDAHDLLTAKKRQDMAINVTFIDDVGKVICDKYINREDNTVVKAVKALRQEFGEFGGLDIVVQKNMGIGGGLGGSASNAVGTVWASSALYGLFDEADEGTMLNLCAKLGSDAAFFAKGMGKDNFCARVQGVGEIVEEVENRLEMSIMIEKGGGLSSKAAYDAFDELYQKYGCIYAPSDNDKLIKYLEQGDRAALDYMHNALDKASMLLDKSIEDRKKALIKKGAKKVMLAGSGASTWGGFF